MLQKGAGCEGKNPFVAAGNLPLIWGLIAVSEQSWVLDTGPCGMTNGFSVSVLEGGVFTKEAGSCSAKGASEAKLSAKAREAKHNHYTPWPRPLVECVQGRERGDINGKWNLLRKIPQFVQLHHCS